jgi:hypothetical protein
MSEPKHIHDCTGPDATCQCGYKLRIERYAVSFDVYDNETKRYIVNSCFMTDQHFTVAAELRRAADKLEPR